jgi:exopolysaccharide biosynthesis polyprenyl glycosylphosphotransferase
MELITPRVEEERPEVVLASGRPIRVPNVWVVPSSLLSLTAARLVVDATAIAAALGASFLLRFQFGWLRISADPTPRMEPHVAVSALWAGGLLAAMATNRLFDEDTLVPGGGEFVRLWKSLLEAIALSSVFVFLTHMLDVSRGWFGLVVLTSALLLVGERAAFRAFVRKQRARGAWRRHAILVSSEGRARPAWVTSDLVEFDITAHLSVHDFFQYRPTSLIRSSGNGFGAGLFSSERPVLIVNDDGVSEDDLWRLVVLAGRVGSPLFMQSPLRVVARDRLSTRELSGRTVVKIAPPTLTGLRATKKRILDITVSLGLLVAGAPLLAVLALAVAITSGWPILYRQERVGKDGRTFRMLKFRTMKRNAEAETGPVWTVPEDPRRTRFGAFLRRTSLDELPQLLNVLRGDMSLVGPRPERPPFVASFSEELGCYADRHRIKPGVTGWAQANGWRGNTDLSPRVEFDNWYIENWSIALDLKILARTIPAVLSRNGAY